MLYVEESTTVSNQEHGSLATTAYHVSYQHRTSLWYGVGLWFIFELEDFRVVMSEKRCSSKLCLCPLPARDDHCIKLLCQ